MFGHAASSHTVWRPLSRITRRSSRKLSPCRTLTLSQSGLRPSRAAGRSPEADPASRDPIPRRRSRSTSWRVLIEEIRGWAMDIQVIRGPPEAEQLSRRAMSKDDVPIRPRVDGDGSPAGSGPREEEFMRYLLLIYGPQW